MSSRARDRRNGAPVAVEGGSSRHDEGNRTSAASATTTAARPGPTPKKTSLRPLPPGGGTSRHRWQDLPEFCDATAAVSAATYGARRLPEVRALYRRQQGRAVPSLSPIGGTDVLDDANKNASDGDDPSRPASSSSSFGRAEDALRSGGCKTSNRHLRRRATSHLSRKRHRFPEGGSSSSKNNESKEVTTAATGADAPNPPSRRKRRKKRETLCQGRENWRDAPEIPTDRESYGEAGDLHTNYGDDDEPNPRAQWIPTHLWHAKRFRVETLFGWKIPVVHSNRGAKAALRFAREGKTLVQDATYHCQPLVVRVVSTAETSTDGTEKELQRVLPNFRCNLQERRLVDGMLHHRDSFPLRPIGPIQWIVASDAFLFQGAAADERDPSDPASVVLYLFVHASIRNEAIECLRQWASDVPDVLSASVVAHGVPGGMACLRLRGLNAMETLESAGTALGCDFRPRARATFIEASHGTLLSFPSQPGTRGSVVYGVVQCPRDPDLPCNRGSVGLDVWCRPSWASKLWVELVVRGGACPTGLVEQTHLAMEAEPPLPVFPRDYVDTSAGASYWTSGDNLDWKLHRSCLEAGLGRISVSDKGPAKCVNWALVASSSGKAAAVVRGAFGLPFERCFPSTGSEPSTASSGRRRRRPQRPSDAMVHFPPQARDRMAEHEAMCQALLDSLALPTLILCHVLVSGKGAVAAGDTIFDFHSSLPRGRPLGRVTCGAFSPFRGTYHGLAVCGAGRLLETMKSARSFARTDHFPLDRHCLAVRVGNISTKFVGSLSLLF